VKSTLLKLRFLYLGFKNIKKLNIGDEVIYKNKKYSLSSYKYTDTNWLDYWSMVNISSKEYEVHSINDFKKIMSWKNIKNSIQGSYKFYMTNWYSIMLKNLKIKDIFKADYKTFIQLKSKPVFFKKYRE